MTVENSFQSPTDARHGSYGPCRGAGRFVARASLLAGALALATAALGSSGAGAAGGHGQPYLSRFKTVTNVSSTVPGNGDLNPYGIVNVPRTEGALVRGDALVSNFNAASNLQGTGTTIVQVSPSGQQTLFAHSRESALAASVSRRRSLFCVAGSSWWGACR